MLIAYRPELENPPREGGLGVVTDAGMIQLSPGVNLDVPETKWAQARLNLTVKRLMAIGAIEELKEQATVKDVPQSIDALASLPLSEALRILEVMHDTEQLADWVKVEGRTRVRNAIRRRLETIRIGKA
jgi:hypothetical protein